MSSRYLGDFFDIHMGGVDNIFPHHENEIAQSRCATGKEFVKYWLHCQHLIVDGQKMSKSLGNFHTVRDLLGQGVDAMTLRYLLISTHYRKLLNFSFSGLEQAGQALKRIHDFLFALESHQPTDRAFDNASDLVNNCREQFVLSMDDDFNVSGGLAALFELISAAHRRMTDFTHEGRQAITGILDELNSVLGVLSTRAQAQDLDADVEEQIRKRDEARKQKDFKTADTIRDDLRARGIVLLDTPDGVKWKRE